MVWSQDQLARHHFHFPSCFSLLLVHTFHVVRDLSAALVRVLFGEHLQFTQRHHDRVGQFEPDDIPEHRREPLR